MASGERFLFDHDQIKAYLDRIELPEEKRQYNVADKDPGTQLEYLTLLQKHHLVHVKTPSLVWKEFDFLMFTISDSFWESYSSLFALSPNLDSPWGAFSKDCERQEWERRLLYGK